MKVRIPTPLRSYTATQSVIEADGATVGKMLAEIDRRYPGFRFRIIDEQDGIREHIKIFINEKPARSLSAPLQPGDTIHIICALSGGV
ncbi:MAG: MoaD/ThiS family protein [Deltaproteobacteria bacterium]|nr:MoaD/ThiS family protein [Deltaproteobacteria bacterium]